VVPGLVVRTARQERDACVDLSQEEAGEYLHRGRGMMWIDIVGVDSAAARRYLQEDLGFHELAVEDALSPNERPTLQEFSDHLFFVVPALIKGQETAVEVGFFLTRNAVVTVADQPVPTVEKWFERWRTRPKRFEGQPALLLHSIVDALVDDYFPVVDAMEDDLDELADRIFAGDTHRVKEILTLKRLFLETRRQIAPVRDIMNGLLRRDLQLVPMRTKPYFQDVLDHVIRVAEILDMNRETLASMLDVHLSMVSNNLNNVVKKMTMVATVLMVMTLISSIYGMNFDFMPELHWALGYPFALGLMGVLALATLYVFKRIRWIE
jgi:magnesium transporter